MNWDDYTRRFGRHSKIPQCCIDAFIDGTATLKPTDSYAKCGACRIADREVIIHRCTANCIPFLQSIGANVYGATNKEANEEPTDSRQG